jgi:hypothetical protein
MKIELSNGVIVITPPEISGKIQAILFPETEPVEDERSETLYPRGKRKDHADVQGG